jgi:hypothetical protein
MARSDHDRFDTKSRENNGGKYINFLYLQHSLDESNKPLTIIVL